MDRSLALVIFFSVITMVVSGCERPASSQATLVVSGWNGSSTAPMSASPFSIKLNGVSSWGSPAVTALGDVDCIGVLITADSTGSQSCESSSGNIAFTDAVGFVGPNQSISVEVTAGKNRVIRLVGISLLEGMSCPTLLTIDRLKVSKPRIIGEVTQDLVPGENVVHVTANMSGPELKSCSGSQFNPTSDACNLVSQGQVGTVRTDEVIVHLSLGETLAQFQSQFSTLGMTLQGSWTPLNSYHFSLPSGTTAIAATKTFCQSGSVQFVEPVELALAPRYYTSTNDDSAATNAQSLVAIVDTGLELAHPVLSDFTALWSNSAELGADEDGNGFENDQNGWNFFDDIDDVEDDEGHGTSMAGMVLKQAVDIFGSPMASPILVMPVKVMDNTGLTDSTRVAAGILYATQNNADVIFIGAASNSHSEIIRRAMIYAANRGVLIVAPAGNSTTDNDIAPVFPASFWNQNLLSVTGHNASNTMAAFSNFGSTTVHLAAPGVSELTMIMPGTFGSLSGTSPAAAAVAGASAYAKNQAIQLSGSQLKQIVLNTVTTSAAFTGKTTSGGRINSASLNAAMTAYSGTAYSQPQQ